MKQLRKGSAELRRANAILKDPWGAFIRTSCKSTGFGTRLSLCTPRGVDCSPRSPAVVTEPALPRGKHRTARGLQLGGHSGGGEQFVLVCEHKHVPLAQEFIA